MSDLTAAILFVMAVGVFIVVGVLVGIIVAGRMDRLMAPRPPKPADEPVAGEVAPEPEEEQP